MRRLRIEEIAVWENGLEAWITAGWDDGLSVTFFDTRYYANSDRYKIGETHEFALAGLAYLLEVTRPEPAYITNPETIRAMRMARPPEEGDVEAAIDLSPIEVRMEGAAILFPREDLSPDDCEFQAPVKEIDTFHMNGCDVLRFRCTVLRAEQDIDIELYATPVRCGAHDRELAMTSVVFSGCRGISPTEGQSFELSRWPLLELLSLWLSHGGRRADRSCAPSTLVDVAGWAAYRKGWMASDPT